MTFEDPEVMAKRVRAATVAASGDALALLLTVAIETDREHIAAKCDEWAAKAQREADAQWRYMRGTPPDPNVCDRIARCEGQAAAFRTLAAILKTGVPARAA